MDTATRVIRYGANNGRPETMRMTPRQRRRMIKKAGRDPLAIVVRDDGMGYSPAKQGYRQLVELLSPPQLDECFACGGPLASDGVCADDTCGD